MPINKYIESKSNALKQANHLSQNIEFSLQLDKFENDNLRLIGFCLRTLGAPTKELFKCDGGIQRILDFNDISYRSVAAPEDPQTTEYPVLIATKSDSKEPIALYRKNRVNYFYSASEQISIAAKDADFTLDEVAYEIYPSLPAFVRGPLDVLRFTFASETNALLAFILAYAVVTTFNLCIPLLTNFLVAKILPQQNASLLLETLAVVFLILSGAVLSLLFQTLMLLRLEVVSDLRLQTSVMDRLLRLPISFIRKYNTGDLVMRVDAISQLRQILGTGILSSILSVIFGFSYFILMFYYDRRLAFAALIFAGVSLASCIYLASKQVSYEAPLIEQQADLTNFSHQSLLGAPQIRSAGSEPFLYLRWMQKIGSIVYYQLNSNVFRDALQIFTLTIIPISSLWVFAVLSYQLLNTPSQFSANQMVIKFVSFNSAYIAFNATLASSATIVSDVLAKAIVLWNRAKPVVYANVETGYRPDTVRRELSGLFKFDNVNFKYPNSSNVLFDNLTFETLPGKHTAITGESGCGKTTLLRMLLGFEDIDGGQILIDNVPLQQISIRHYRKQLGVVMQNVNIGSQSIYEVVCGGLPFPDEKVWEALELAQVADEVAEFPMKLETGLSEGAQNISGGQRQRIGIARALIHRPKVLLLDEATSALDNLSQLNLTRVLEELQITRVTIAHRLSTIKDADRVITIKDKCAYTK